MSTGTDGYVDLVDPWADLPHLADQLVAEHVDQAETTGLRAELLNRTQIASLPKPEPLIDGTLDRRTVAVLAGHWGTGKTFLALDWAACVATGKPWIGRATANVGPVLYVAGEGAYGIHQRLDVWEYAWQQTIPPDRLMVLPRPIHLGDRHDVARIGDVACDLGAGLVVIDTLARCAVGLDENSAKDMGIVVDGLYRIRNAMHESGGTVSVLHHTGKDKTTVRGSSALEGGVDTVYQVEDDGGLITLARTKRKDGPREDRIQLRLETPAGRNVPVLMSARGADMTGSEQRLMSAYLSAFTTTGASKSELRMVADMPSASFHRGLDALISNGELVNTGSDARPFYKLGRNS